MNAPTVRAILKALAAAGDEGMLARTMTLQFSYPEDVSRRTIRVRSALRDLERVGRARRSDTTEPTPYHTHAPVYRWFITPDGRRYLKNGCRPDSLVARDTRRQEAEAARQHRAQIVAEARLAGYGPETRGPERTAKARELYAAGCTLASIASLFGISTERVRQIAGLKPRSTA
jgi:hypothetical protein